MPQLKAAASLPTCVQRAACRGRFSRDSLRRMPTLSLQDGTESFQVTWLEAERPARVVLFAVGGGGNPERHLTLLNALVEHGCSVVAPHCERLVAPRPTEADLSSRARRLKLALDFAAQPGTPVVGLGHSIGTTLLLALAGAKIWLSAAGPLALEPELRLERLLLLAPATGFFQAPHALDAVRASLEIWAATDDHITPLAQAEYLQRELAARVPLVLHVCEGAGHFSFMHLPPPNTVEPLVDRDAFLAELTRQVCNEARRVVAVVALARCSRNL